MFPTRISSSLFAITLLSLLGNATAQILTTGNTQLPACASSCPKLNQAVQACGGVSASNQGVWVCFCQSAYLTTLYNTPAGVCDETCADPGQRQQIMTWYKSNCGTDKGVSEHPDNGNAAAPAGQSSTAPTNTGSATATGTGSSISGIAATGTFVPGQLVPPEKGTWWENHSKWVVMLIVLFIGFTLLTLLLIWLKRRHNRKRDQLVGSFNEGITMHSQPMETVANPAPVHNSSGRDSPSRTRDAFMPYGYGYSRSESKLGSRTNVGDTTVKSSPLAHDGTTLAQLEKSMDDTGHSGGGKKKRVYVRERSISGRDSPEQHR